MTITDTDHLPGKDVLASDGHKAGNVEEVLYDRDTDEAVVVLVATGILGRHVTLIPLAGASRDAKGRLLVPYDRAHIHDAPHHDPDFELTAADEAALFAHYGVAYPGGHGTTSAHPRRYVTQLPPTLS
jgi:sporulation protein YlmC with PRC-barrel domain